MFGYFQANTYQAVVITDGSKSYAVFTYMCDLMQWSGLYRYPTIGFSAAGTLFSNHPLTGQEEASSIDCIDGTFNSTLQLHTATPRLAKAPLRSQTAFTDHHCTWEKYKADHSSIADFNNEI